MAQWEIDKYGAKSAGYVQAGAVGASSEKSEETFMEQLSFLFNEAEAFVRHGGFAY